MRGLRRYTAILNAIDFEAKMQSRILRSAPLLSARYDAGILNMHRYIEFGDRKIALRINAWAHTHLPRFIAFVPVWCESR